jgi:cytochrome c-type biogenesis protein CcmH|tara:strand:+ start:2524 stop:2901 length:378 start_codon:yes stop_codon:yes gene_type:complete
MKKVCLILLLISTQVSSIEGNEDLTSQERELYQQIIQEVRCLVCQNQSVAESNADLAKDLRTEIMEQVKQGSSEDDIKSYLLLRYGDFVLYDPSFKKSTYILWLSPVLIILLILGWLRKIGVIGK